MKTLPLIVSLLACCFMTNGNVRAETIHQTVKGADAFTGDGGKALDKKVIEVTNIPGTGDVARLVGSVGQWGFVNFWFGLPAPAGKAIVRFKVYVDGTDTASFAVYINDNMTKFTIPPDAKKNSLVTVEIPVDSSKEWNGLVFKKIDASSKPGPWIESISVVLP